MQNVVSDKPYAFIPPRRATWWPRFLQHLLPWRLRSAYGIETVTCVGTDKLAASLASGHGVLLTPNHSRPSDPEVMHEVLGRMSIQPYMMASWHLFMQNPLQSFLLSSSGAFSVYREGTDRAAVTMATELLDEGLRPLVLFPEGVQTRSNDRLNPLLDGAAFIARMAAKRRRDRGTTCGIVIHPVAMRYRHDDGVLDAVLPVLADIERRLSWRPQNHLTIEARLAKVGAAILSLKEIEYFDTPRDGTLAERTAGLIDGLLLPLETEWIHGLRETDVIPRVKALRGAILHDMLHGDLDTVERTRRWGQMTDLTLAQSVSFYPPEYLGENVSPEHLIETMERLEEDLTDRCTTYGPLRVEVTFGDALPVDHPRARGNGTDPLLTEIERSLKQLLGIEQ